jgi:hypothetical protein
MKRYFFFTVFLLVSALCFFCPAISFAQHAAIKQKIERDMEKKYADSQRIKGKKELEKVTYENDKRYKDPKNKVQATIAFETKEFNKKGEEKSTSVQKMVFGKVGECIVMNEGEKNETWMIYNYADKANYLVDLKSKTAMKMPLISMKKMAEASAKKEDEKSAETNTSSWKATGEKQNINGYNCTKYVYTYDDKSRFATMDYWMTDELKLDLGDNYMFGARLNEYKYSVNPKSKDMPHGLLIRNVMYNKKGVAVSQRDLKSFQKSADENYFDMSKFKINDILGGL